MNHRIRVGVGGLAACTMGSIAATVPTHILVVVAVGCAAILALSWTLIAGAPSMVRAVERIEREREG